ncbi:uncharacterized protein LOC103960815 [Pyrus x bretschneideri]|nr:uncharacterized protein LOC103960815 [Pyrus x bretschneideri]
MDSDKDVGNDSDSFVIVSNANSVCSDSESVVGTDSENYVIVSPQNNVATDSGEDLFVGSTQQSKNVEKDAYVCSDSDSGESTYSEEADNASYLSTDSEVFLFDESEQQLKNEDMSTDSVEELSDGFGKQLKIMDNQHYMDTVLPGKQLKMRHCSSEFHTYPCKRIRRAHDCSELPRDERLYNKKMDISDVAMENVLPFLPAKMLCRLRTVSKLWDKWIFSPFFSHKQTYYFREISGLFCQAPGGNPYFLSLDNDAYGIPRSYLSFLPEPVTVKATCNGLVCCQSEDREDTYYICNPVNMRFRKLPKSGFYHGPESYAALAFEPSVLDFEVCFQLVCAFSVPGHPGVHFDMYSSRSSGWELAETVCYELETTELEGYTLYLKGVLFWETLTGVILAFDVKEQQYGILPLPFSTGPRGVISQMNGELCYILPRVEFGQFSLEIYGNMDMSLKQKIYLVGQIFTSFVDTVRLLACVNDDVMLILVGQRVIAYGVKAGEEKVLKILDYGLGAGNERYLPYVNSLVQI